jgi:hypothetical protein
MSQELFETLLEELIDGQQKQLLTCGRRLVPHLTSDDILQPNDFSELEENPHFRYEEGILAGMLTVRAALQSRKAEALLKDRSPNV